jgi:RNA recognition motif-containing protein
MRLRNGVTLTMVQTAERRLHQLEDESMRIVIGNLPEGISEESLREALKSFAPAENIRLTTGSSVPSGVIEMEISRVAADTIARRIQGHVLQGQALNAWVPTMAW